MPTQAFISGLPEVNNWLLPTVIVGVWMVFLLLQLRRQQSAATTVIDLSADSSQGVSPKLIHRAANRIEFDLGNMALPQGYGRGRNPRMVSGKTRVVSYADFEPGTHNPQHIDLHASYTNPLGIDQVGLRHQPHKEKLLVVVDMSNVNLAGSPNDYVDAITAMEGVAETIVQSATRRHYPTGLIGPRGNSSVYVRPGSTANQLIDAIDRLSPAETSAEIESFHRLVLSRTQGIKGIMVISTFQEPQSQRLMGNLPHRPRRFAIQISGEWDNQLGGLPDWVNIEASDNQPRRTNIPKIQDTHRKLAKQEQTAINKAVGPGTTHLKLRRDELDLPGQLANQFHPTAA